MSTEATLHLSGRGLRLVVAALEFAHKRASTLAAADATADMLEYVAQRVALGQRTGEQRRARNLAARTKYEAKKRAARQDGAA